MSRSRSTIVTGGEYTLQESHINVTDEKLKSLLMQVYETARRDANNSSHWFNHYPEAFSIFITLLVTLVITMFTGNFKEVWMCYTFGGFTVMALVTGIVMMYAKMKHCNQDVNTERDNVVRKVLEDTLVRNSVA